MKTQTMVMLSLLITLTTAIGCKKQDAAAISAATGAATGGTVSKATLSAWNIGNSAWFARLDVNGANLGGTPFTLVFKYSDNSEVHCTNTTLSGTESAGTYDIAGNCTGPGTASMADSGPTNFETSGVGSYSNNGAVLKLCRTGTNSCGSYYP